MDTFITLLNTLNTLSPLAVIALLGIVIFMLVKAKSEVSSEMSTHVDVIKSNDLHELPEMAETLRRIELKLGEEFSYIRARLNGGPRG